MALRWTFYQLTNRNRMSETSILGLTESFQPYQLVLFSLATIYAALFVMVSNHYVFKPKIQNLFLSSSIHSTILYQFLIDFLTNLTQLTFIITSLLFLQDDNSLSVMIYSDMSWCGILMTIVAFKALAAKEEANYRLLLLKNVIFLSLIYAVVGSHYFLSLFLIDFGIEMMLFYVLNLVANGYQEKFVEAMEMLFGYKPNGQIEDDYSHNNNMPGPQYLSRSFPISKIELAEHIRGHYSKLKSIQLKTKRAVVENLLKISLSVHLSKMKMEMKAKRDVKYYYGTFNGTVIQKSKKMIIEKNNTKQETGSQAQLTEQHTTEDFEIHNSAIFYIFPVKFFDGNKVISVLFSLVINLGLGILLSVTLKISETFKYGQYFHILYGLLLLPVLPSVSKEEFLSSMALSSLWKYCLYGLCLCICCLTSSDGISFDFPVNSQLIFAPFIQLFVLVLSAYFVFSRTSSPYYFSFIWMGGLIATAYLIFKYC